MKENQNDLDDNDLDLDNPELELDNQELDLDNQELDLDNQDQDNQDLDEEGEAPKKSFRGEPAPEWVKDLRKTNREKEKRIRELEALVKQSQASNDDIKEPPQKPKLIDFDYDEETYLEAVDKWLESKQKFDDKKKQTQRAIEEQELALREKMNAYNKAKEKRKLAGYQDAEDTMIDLLSNEQQAILLQIAEDPVSVVYLAGKDYARAKKLANCRDKERFAYEVAKFEMEANRMLSRKKPRSEPEETVKTGGQRTTSGGNAAMLEKLKDEAIRTGDMSKYTEYTRKMAQKSKG